ncbi:MAG: periplasmic heavy metal sensor [Desulfosarcina sp.]|jgi:Spy/CpxP family protein refolding chaperone
MRPKTFRNGLAALIAVALMATGTTTMAGNARGYAQKDRGHGGCGDCGRYQGRGDCPGGRGWADITPEQREQMDAERQAYVEATRRDRQDLYAKQMALRAEIAKSEPDPAKAAALQKAVSDLEADLDQKRLQHILAMRKINPDAGRGFFMHGSRGMGRQKAHGSGCWRQ